MVGILGVGCAANGWHWMNMMAWEQILGYVQCSEQQRARNVVIKINEMCPMSPDCPGNALASPEELDEVAGEGWISASLLNLLPWRPSVSAIHIALHYTTAANFTSAHRLVTVVGKISYLLCFVFCPYAGIFPSVFFIVTGRRKQILGRILCCQ